MSPLFTAPNSSMRSTTSRGPAKDQQPSKQNLARLHFSDHYLQVFAGRRGLIEPDPPLFQASKPYARCWRNPNQLPFACENFRCQSRVGFYCEKYDVCVCQIAERQLFIKDYA